MANKRYVIGDVHGHYDALKSLLDNIAPDKEDEVYFLGDLIDRGPQSDKVVELVINNGYQCLLGNHEVMLLDVLGEGEIVNQAFNSWVYNGGYATIKSYDNKIPQKHIDWFRQLPLYLDLGDFLLVHAGVHPNMTMEEQTADQFCWIRDEFHASTTPYFEDKLIIIGHTITFTFPGAKPGQLVAGQGWLSIDTGVYHHRQGWLTALELNEPMVYQVNSFGKAFRKKTLEKAIYEINPSKILVKQ